MVETKGAKMVQRARHAEEQSQSGIRNNDPKNVKEFNFAHFCSQFMAEMPLNERICRH